jgi:hypothetical protein
VVYGTAQEFTVTANAGYTVSGSVKGSCPVGSWGTPGAAYATGAIKADCTVIFSATINSYTVTPSGDGNESIGPSNAQPVTYGGTQAFTVTASTGYTLSPTVSGTCSGSWGTGASANVYTVGPVSASCNVAFSAALNTYPVAASGDGNETISPSDPQTVGYGATPSYTVNVKPGYTLSNVVGGDCPQGGWGTGSSANVYTTAAITGACQATFSATPQQVTVSPFGDGYETFTPSNPVQINFGTTQAFTVTPSIGYVNVTSPVSGSTCPQGSWSNNNGTYTTAPIIADCALNFAATSAWTKVRQASAGTSEANAVTTDASGNVYVAGYTTTGLNSTAIPAGQQDYFVIKYSPSGSATWTQERGATASKSFAQAIFVDSAGNVYIAGATWDGQSSPTPGSPGLFGPQTGMYDFFVAKYDSAGNLAWGSQMGTPSMSSQAFGVVADSSGNVFVSGYTNGGLDGHPEVGNYDYFIAEYDSSGKFQWLNQYNAGAGASVNVFGMTIDGSANLYLTGSTTGPLTSNNTLTGATDSFAAKFDSSGKIQWATQIGSANQHTIGSGIALDASGDIYFTGYTDGPINTAQSGKVDYFLAKLSSSGGTAWVKQLGGVSGSLTYSNAVSIAPTGNISITGFTTSGLNNNTITGTQDAFLAQYDPTGKFLGLEQLGASGVMTTALGAAVDPAGSTFMVGYTYGSLNGSVNGTGPFEFAAKYNSNGALQ